MNAKILMLFIAVVAVGLFAMPSTVSLISGQHAFINYTDGTNDCSACHGGVSVTGGAHVGTTWVNQSDQSGNWNCRGCHLPGAVNTSTAIPANDTAGTYLVNITGNLHVAKVARCVVCHDGADKFNGSSVDAHKPLADNSSNSQANTTTINNIAVEDRVCITCHTQAAIIDTSNLNETTTYNVSVDKAGGVWNVTYLP